MKKLYALAVALVLISVIVLLVPPSMSLAANCSAVCDSGEIITIQQASWCSCIENIGCVWRRDGKDHARKFTGAELCITTAGWEDQ